MAVDTTIYTLPYIRRRETYRDAYDVIANTFAKVFGPGSIVDVGCAGGLLVEALRQSGFEAWGVDGAPACEAVWPTAFRSAYIRADLTSPSDVCLPETEYVCTLEVAEHLPGSAAYGFVSLLVRHKPRRVLFTAAPIGQPGLGHVNCQPFSYWLALFAACGYQLDPDGTCRVRQELRAQLDDHKIPVVPRQYVDNFLALCPATESIALSADVRQLVSREIQEQRQVFEHLSHRGAHVLEGMAILGRSLGGEAELSEVEAMRLRVF